MSRDHTFEPSPTPSEQPVGNQNSTASARDLEGYPERLFAKDMATIYRISLKRFYALSSEGAYDFAVIRPTVGRVSYSRERVRQHFNGELRGLTVARKRA